MQSAIEKLKDPSSAAVVGGQQAGLLTGPLYTIHKIISIIVLAKEQEKQLQVPVIPIFGWPEKTTIWMRLILSIRQKRMGL